jgi:agmatine/peptidylarginine deiminase
MSDTFRFPAEWEPQSAVLIAWPHPDTDWGPRLVEVEETYIALVAAIATFENAVICIADDDLQAYAEARLRSARVDMDRVRFVTVEYDDTWLRDSGPITLCSSEGSRFRLLDFRFTGWGGKFEASRDDRLVEALCAAGIFARSERSQIDFALEGGGIETDGAGTLLTTWRCLHERHPQATREQLSARLADWLAQDRVLWLDCGYLEGDDTDAHIDTLARFAATDAIIYQACDDVADTHYDELQAMEAELARLRTRDGKPYRLFALPWPKPIFDDGRRRARAGSDGRSVSGASDRAGAVPAVDLAERQPALHHDAIACGRPRLMRHCIAMIGVHLGAHRRRAPRNGGPGPALQ